VISAFVIYLGDTQKSNGDYASAAENCRRSLLISEWDASAFKSLSDCLKEMNEMKSPEQILEDLYKDPAEFHKHAAQICSAQG